MNAEVPSPFVPPVEIGELLKAKSIAYRIVDAGLAVLVGGTVTVSTINANTANVFQLTNNVTGGTAGLLRVGTVTAGTSFVINSADAADTSTIGWVIFGAIR